MRTEQPFAKNKNKKNKKGEAGQEMVRSGASTRDGGLFRDHIQVPVKGVSLKQREKEGTEAAGFWLP